MSATTAACALKAGSFLVTACHSVSTVPTSRQTSCMIRPSRALASPQRALKASGVVGSGSVRQARSKVRSNDLPLQFLGRPQRHELHAHLAHARHVLVEVLHLLAGTAA